MLKPVADRRTFIRVLTFGTAAGWLAGKSWQTPLLADSTPQAPGDPGVLRVRISDFPALQQNYGSIRLGVNPIGTGDDSFPIGRFYPVIITRDPDEEFYVLDSMCSHAQCVVPPYNHVRGYSECPCHQSRYSFDGYVLSGQAPFPLTPLAYEYDGVDELKIHVPGLEHALSVAPVGAGGNRLRLTFNSFLEVKYEVLFRATVDDPWSVAPVALTPEGPVNVTVIEGTDLPVTVYAGRTGTTGFYAVALKTLNLP